MHHLQEDISTTTAYIAFSVLLCVHCLSSTETLQAQNILTLKFADSDENLRELCLRSETLHEQKALGQATQKLIDMIYRHQSMCD